VNLEEQVTREIKKLQDHFVPGNYGQESYKKWSTDRTCMLRFDGESVLDLPEEEQLANAFKVMNEDLLDLVINGDVNDASDALLRSCDGLHASRKRGKEVVEVVISSAQLHQAVNLKKNTREFTLFLVLYLGKEDIKSQ
jgi:hypothetical protein